MEGQDQRAALKAAIERDGTSLTWLSERLLKRNAAYLQQYLTRGTPRLLAEGDRRLLAKFLRVSDAALGGVETAGDDSIVVPRYVLAASAGPGALIGEEQRGVPFRFDARFLAGLGVRRDAAAGSMRSGSTGCWGSSAYARSAARWRWSATMPIMRP
jgi:repressor LexA